MFKLSRKMWFTIILVGATGAGLAAWVFQSPVDGSALPRTRPEDVPFDGERAYKHLLDICAIGRRISGTPGMKKQQELLTAHFTKAGGKVRMQEFNARHPQTGQMVKMSNMIVEFHPQRKERVLLCAHYDTRPFPDQDPKNPRGLFIGANDGASGVAVLMEMARLLPTLEGRFGVDIVLFDGEELVYDGQRDPYFLGSTHFANQYKATPPAHRYRCGVLLDMVGDKSLQLYKEKNSLYYARQVTNDLWSVARSLGAKEFNPRARHTVRDDHLPLNQIARIPTCDIIDFDYPRPGFARQYWHTEADIPENCSAESLGIVGKVVFQYLRLLQNVKN